MTQNPATVCRVIASLLLQLNNLYQNKNLDTTILVNRVMERIDQVVKDFMPSGSGVDKGTMLDDGSHPDKLEFIAPYHHMDDSGYYDGWTDHRVVVKPSLIFGTTIRVTGRDRNNIKEYLDQLFDTALGQMVVWNTEQEKYVMWVNPLDPGALLKGFKSTKIEIVTDPTESGSSRDV